MKTAIGYLRVSTVGQAEEGVSLAAQEAKIRAFCDLRGFNLEAVYSDEGISGSTMRKRPGLAAALEHVERTGGVLVVYSLSRMSRSLRDTLAVADRLDKTGADLASLSENLDTTSAMGKFCFNLFGALNQLERDLASERTAAALAHKRSMSEKTGGDIPFGYRLAADGRLEKNPSEWHVVEEITRLRSAGWSLRRIAADLEGRGILARGKSKWHPQTIKNILDFQAAA
ncbi:MAG TPA: recombinase family protein [Candidatus Brocadiia bacterium]|nr:recombinase family protein [Candidatus Brocadiia bacterium]